MLLLALLNMPSKIKYIDLQKPELSLNIATNPEHHDNFFVFCFLFFMLAPMIIFILQNLSLIFAFKTILFRYTVSV